MKKLGSLLLILALLIGTVPNAFATIEEKEQELENVQQQIDAKNAEIEQAAHEVALTQGSIEEVMANQQRLEAQIQQTDEDIVAKKKDIERIQKELGVAKAEVTAQQNEYGDRLRVIYLNQDSENALSLLLKSKSIEDFLIKLQFMKTIVEEDKRVLEELNIKQRKIEEMQKIEAENLEELNTLQLALEQDKQDLILVKAALDQRKAELQERQAQLEAETQALTDTSNQIRASVDSMRQEALRIAAEQEAARLAALQAQNGSGTVPPASGQTGMPSTGAGGINRGELSLSDIPASGFVWPTPGVYTITSPFGPRVDPIMGNATFHEGLDIGGPMGSPVVASANGIVIYAGWFNNGYGNCVIISHPGGYETVYAHGSAVNTTTGAIVNQGEVVMYMGSTGYSTGSHLHFEMILNGGLIDPLTMVAP